MLSKAKIQTHIPEKIRRKTQKHLTAQELVCYILFSFTKTNAAKGSSREEEALREPRVGVTRTL